MALKSMKRTPADEKARKEKYKGEEVRGGDEYPWGLRLNLDDEILRKLGVKALPKVGARMAVNAEVSVVAVHRCAATGGTDERSLELQITRMELSPGSAASALDAVDAAIDEAD